MQHVTRPSSSPRNRGVVTILLVVLIALSAAVTVAGVEKAMRTQEADNSHAFTNAGRAIGTIVGGPLGGEVGGYAGGLLALILGGVAAQRHGAATAALAQLRTYEADPPPRRRRRS